MSGEKTEILKEFLREIYILLSALEEELVQNEKKPKVEISFEKCLEIVHTIKGTSACLGLEKIVNVCHEYESLMLEGKCGFDVLFQKFYLIKKYCFDIEKEERIKNHHQEKMLVSVNAMNDCLEDGKNSIFLSDVILKSMEKYQVNEKIYDSMIDLRGLMLKQQKRLSAMKAIPMGKFFQPLRGYVGDYVRGNPGKDVDICVDGDNVMVDISLATVFNNTLTHLVNNSLEHGLESMEERSRVGKALTGKISIRCYEKEGHIIIEVEDDGRGFAREKIIPASYDEHKKSKSEDEDWLELVFRNGFSTADQVTERSGRGVGMSVVKNTVEQAGGWVDVESEYGKGCRVKISIPLLEKFDVVKLININDFCSIRLEDVVEVIGCDKKNCENIFVYNLEDDFLLGYHDRILPLVDLENYLNGTQKRTECFGKIIVVKTQSYFYGLIVSDISDIKELMVEKIVGETYCSGAALSKCGRASLILDVDSIGKDCNIGEYSENVEKQSGKKDIPYRDFLLFDMGKHKNYAIFLEDIYRIESYSRVKTEHPLTWMDEALGLEQAGAHEMNVLIVKKDGQCRGFVVGAVKGIERTGEDVDGSIRDREGIRGVVIFEDKMASLVDWEYLLEIAPVGVVF